MMKKISIPFERSIEELKAGDILLLSGRIYTARDMAHLRLVEMIKNNEELPFPLENQVIYYCGPTPPPPGKIIGSAGPTTSRRMDKFVPMLLQHGLKGMIGKGPRSEEVITAIKEHKAVYFLAPGGCGALLSKCILKATMIAFPELGPEGIFELDIRDFPVIVGIDSEGKNIVI